MTFKDYRWPVFLVTVGMAAAWVAVLFATPLILLDRFGLDLLKSIDPTVSLFVGVGIGQIVGQVTSAFVVVFTLMYQFWFRKSGPTEAAK
ncbi:MAG: hypothetical protein WC683_13565 [bacterium]